MLLGGCSLGMFGDGKDLKLVSAPYHQVNTACSGMDLSSPEMNVPTFRSLLSCFNAQGGLEPIQQLVNRMSDSQVESLIAVSNRYFLQDQKVLYQFNRTWRSLEERGTIDETLRQFGRVSENEEFLSSLIVLLKEKYVSGRNGKLLLALERLSKKLDPGSVAHGIDLAVTVAESSSYRSLEPRFRGDSPSGRGLRAITDGMLAFFREGRQAGSPDLGKGVIRAIVDHQLLETLDQVTGRTSEEMRVKVPKQSSVLKVTLADHGRILDGTNSLFHFLHREPIRCLQGSRVVQDGVKHVIRELSEATGDATDFIRRRNTLSLVAMNPFCEYPAQLGQYYPMMMELADTNAMEPAADLLRAFYSVQKPGRDGTGLEHPLVDVLVDLLSFTSADSGSPAGGLKHLIPLLSEVHDREALDDVLLLGAILPEQERAKLKETLAFLIAPAPELGGDSVYDVLADAVSGTRPGDLYDLVRSLRLFVDADEPIVAPALRVLRAAYHVNDVHPVLEIARRILADASKNKAFFDTLMQVSEMPEFRAALRHVSDMSKDGRMKEVLTSMVLIYEKFALGGQSPVRDTSEPAFVPLRRHDLAARDLVAYPVVKDPEGPNDPCRKLDPSLSMADTTDPRYGEQVENMVACLNKNGQYADVAAAVEFFRSQKTEDGRSFFDLQIDLMKQLGLSPSQTGYLMDAWTGAFDDGRFFRLLDAIPFWVTREFAADRASGKDLGPVLEPLLDLARPLLEAGGGKGQEGRAPLRRIEEYGAKVLRRDDFPSVMKYVHDLSKLEPEPEPYPVASAFDLERLDRWVRAKECRASGVRERSLEIVREFRETVTSWDLASDGNPKRAWTLSEMRQSLGPVLDKMAKPHAKEANPANPKTRVLDSMLGIMRYFTLAPGQKPNRFQHYPPEHLMRWLKERSNDYRPILYYYPGEDRPRVRLVNTLDRLDLVLVNADFDAPIIKTNFGLKFLAEIAEAWGDEPYEIWPDEIKKKFPNGTGMRTIAQVIQSIHESQDSYEGMVGFPKLPSCAQNPTPGEPEDPSGGGWVPGMSKIKPSLFNIRQTMSVLDENRDNGGMRVLRDIFFELYSSTPVLDQSPTSAENNLHVILKTVRMGVFRQLGRLLLDVPADDPAANDLFRALIHGSVSPEISPLMTSLVVSKDREVLWKLVEQIFATLESGDAARGHFQQMGYFMTASAGQFGITDAFLGTIRGVLDNHGKFLLRHGDELRKLLASKRASYFARALYEDGNLEAKYRLADVLRDALSDRSRGIDAVSLLRSVKEDPKATRSWERFSLRLEALQSSPDYAQLRVDEIIEEILRFFENQSEDPVGPELALRLRLFLAERLDSRDLDQFLLLARDKPNEFYRVLRTLSREVENGDLKDLFRLARRSLSNPR